MSLPGEVFLSHASEDAARAVEIVAVLREHGLPVWYAPHQVLGAVLVADGGHDAEHRRHLASLAACVGNRLQRSAITRGVILGAGLGTDPFTIQVTTVGIWGLWATCAPCPVNRALLRPMTNDQ